MPLKKICTELGHWRNGNVLQNTAAGTCARVIVCVFKILKDFNDENLQEISALCIEERN